MFIFQTFKLSNLKNAINKIAHYLIGRSWALQLHPWILFILSPQGKSKPCDPRGSLQLTYPEMCGIVEAIAVIMVLMCKIIVLFWIVGVDKEHYN